MEIYTSENRNTGLSVLIIDTDVLARATLKLNLLDLGVSTVFELSSGTDLRNSLKFRKIDLVICDRKYCLDPNEMDIIDNLLSDYNIPIIFQSQSDTKHIDQFLTTLRPKGIGKPYDYLELQQVLHECLNQKVAYKKFSAI